MKCPRSYFLKNIYRNPDTGHKIKIMSPPLALGQTVHEVIDSLSILPKDKRLNESLIIIFDSLWQKVSGKKGGFASEDAEQKYKKRGEEMLGRIMKHPGPLLNFAVKIKMEIPYFWLSEESNIILCGKIDWLEYIKENDSVHIIDFKTNVREESSDSLQLPIYYLLARYCQHHPVSKASYWYLERSDAPVEKELPDAEESKERILELAKKIKLARQLGRFKCPHGAGGCIFCKPFEAIIRKEAEFIGTNNHNEDVYILDKSADSPEEESVIL